MAYRITVLVVCTIGLIPAVTFCVLYAASKTSSWWSLLVYNAFGFPFAMALLYLNSIIITVLNLNNVTRSRSISEWLTTIILGAFIDSLLWARLAVFLRSGKDQHGSLDFKSRKDVESDKEIFQDS